jgi:hypothetical protein
LAGLMLLAPFVSAPAPLRPTDLDPGGFNKVDHRKLLVPPPHRLVAAKILELFHLERELGL